MCRDRAENDPLHHDYWIDRAIKWLEQARILSAPGEKESPPGTAGSTGEAVR
jgi:hypothetical protein